MSLLIKIFIFFTFPLLCQAGVGKLFYKKGSVFVDGQVVKRNQQLKEGQIVSTKKDSLAILELDGGSKIKVNESSSIKLRQIDHPKRGTRTFLERGSAFIKVKLRKVGKKTKFTISNKSVSLGVRGTQFYAGHGIKNANDMWVCVNRGKVLVQSKFEKKPTPVVKGEWVRVANGKNTSTPKPLTFIKKLNWNMSPKNGTVINTFNIESTYKDILDEDYD